MAAAFVARATSLSKISALFELAILDAEALGFEDAEELLDGPALPVPIDDLPGRPGVSDGVGGQQPPMYWLDAGRADARSTTSTRVKRPTSASL